MHSALGYTKVQGDIAMNSRERVKRALTFERPDRVPRDLWYLAGVSRSRKPELSRLLETYPSDFTGPQGTYGPSPLASGSEGDVGEYTDAWGCTFVMAEPGVCGEVRNPPLADWSELDTWAPPWMILEHMDLSQVDAACAATDKFVRTGTHVRPFERMQFLRGSENLFMDIAMRPPEFEDLRRQIHDFNLRDIEAWCETAVDGIAFMDDWGTQNALLIAPAQWREIFKPMYKEYCELIKSAGKLVFFHSDGHISDVIPDLIEIGVDALNLQLFCMDIEAIGKAHKGQVAFWGEIDRQKILPFGTVEEVRGAVKRVRRALDDPSGGVIAQCEWGNRDPYDNVAAVFETWLEPCTDL